MNPAKILVFDDVEAIASTWVQRIENGWEGAQVNRVGKDAFLSLLKVINNRRSKWREDEGATIDTTHQADTADVIVVDYDLLQYLNASDTTGSRLAYLLRCYSECGFIIVLNQFGSNDFQFTLGSSPESFADLHVGDVQLGSPGLWGTPFIGFRPWHWPIVPHASNNFEKCVNDVQRNPDIPILEFLGLDKVVHWLPKRAREFLQGRRRPEEMTFVDFVDSDIATKDRLIPGQMARVAAARVVTLLNSIILPEQSVLVDAPHLVARFPSLLETGREDIAEWNRLCNPSDPGIDKILPPLMKTYKFPSPHWLWRPAWLWPEVRNDERIEEVLHPLPVAEVDWVFCENVSRFVPSEFAQEFRANVSPPYIKRFVFRSDSQGVRNYLGQYSPGTPQDPLQADYVPQAAFSL